jgi:hypothetical protein
MGTVDVNRFGVLHISDCRHCIIVWFEFHAVVSSSHRKIQPKVIKRQELHKQLSSANLHFVSFVSWRLSRQV